MKDLKCSHKTPQLLSIMQERNEGFGGEKTNGLMDMEGGNQHNGQWNSGSQPPRPGTGPWNS